MKVYNKSFYIQFIKQKIHAWTLAFFDGYAVAAQSDLNQFKTRPATRLGPFYYTTPNRRRTRWHVLKTA